MKRFPIQRPFFLALLAALLFGAATPISKLLLDGLSAFQLAGLLYLGAALGVLIPLLRQGSFRLPWQMDRANLTRLLGAILFGGVLGPVLLLAGLQRASAASVALWLNLEMVATAVLGHWLFRDYLTRRSWLAAGGVFLAASVLALQEGPAGIQAGLLVGLAAACWGMDNHLTALIDGITPAQSTFWKGLVAGSVNLGIGLVLASPPTSIAVIGGGLAVGALSYGVSIAAYVTSAQQLGATRSQLLFSSAPFWGVLLSFLLLGERFTAIQFISGAVLVAALSLLFAEQHQHEHLHEGQAHEHEHNHADGHHDHNHPEEPDCPRHCHAHEHPSQKHRHPHWPDIHHRHEHELGA